MSKTVLLYLLLVVPIIQAAQFTGEDEKMLRKAFRILDHDGQKSLNKKLFVNIVQTIRLAPAFNFLKDGETEANEIDSDGSGRVDVNEFLKWCEKFIEQKESKSTEDILRAVFDKIANNNDFIKISVLKNLWNRNDKTISKEKAEEIIKKFDSDNSENISFPEFLEALQ